MPTPAYMLIVGETQGAITEGTNVEDSIGNNWQTDHVDQFMVQEFLHSVMVPCDPQTGQPTGQRILGPICVTKKQDRCSPLLFNALVTGEKLPLCEVFFYRTSKSGKQEHYYTIILRDALLVSMVTRMSHCQDAQSSDRVVEEDLKFSYRAIEVTHIICGTSGSDDWREPIV